MKNKRILSGVVIVLCGFFLAGCRSPELYSSWKNREIAIDGKYTDWDEAASYYNEEEKIVLNLANDVDYLYICLITRNRAIESRIMESSFIVWLDPAGEKNKVFGICFPTGLKAMGMSIDNQKRDPKKDWQDQEDKGSLIDREKENLRDKNFNQRLETLEGLQETLEILNAPIDLANRKRRFVPPGGLDKDKMPTKAGPDQKPDSLNDWPKDLTLSEAKDLGIEARIGRQNDYFVYELKVPLIKSDKRPYAVGIQKGKPVSLGLEIGNASLNNSAGRMSGPGNEPGRFDGGSSFGGENKFRLWLSVVLSSKQGN